MKQLPSLIGNYDHTQILLENWCESIELVLKYIENNKVVLLDYLTINQRENYDKYFDLVTNYYISDHLIYLEQENEEDLVSYYGVNLKQASYIIKELFPFNMLYQLKNLNSYPVTIEGDLWQTTKNALQNPCNNPDVMCYENYGFYGDQIEKMLEVYGVAQSLD